MAHSIKMSAILKEVLVKAWDNPKKTNAQVVKAIGTSLGYSKAEMKNDTTLMTAIWRSAKDKVRRTKTGAVLEREGSWDLETLPTPASTTSPEVENAPSTETPAPQTESADSSEPAVTTTEGTEATGEETTETSTEEAQVSTTEVPRVAPSPEMKIKLTIGNENFDIEGTDQSDVIDKIQQTMKAKRLSKVVFNRVGTDGRATAIAPSDIEDGGHYRLDRTLSAA